MIATRAILIEWFDEGVELGAKWMIVACDTFSHEDYPAYIKDQSKFNKEFKRLNDVNKMSRVMEVYDLKKPRDAQISEPRAFNVPGDFSG